MLKEEVIAQDGSPELPALHPHPAGARARPNFDEGARESVNSCTTVSDAVVRALARRLR